MDLRQKLVSGAAMLVVGQIVAQASIFFRNLVVIRTLTKTDYGIASTLAITVYLVEGIGNLGLDSALIQAKDGDSVRFQRTGQLMRVCQGALLSLLILASAPLIGWLFDLPELVWAYRLMAISPLINSLMHLDTKRLYRVHRYLPHAVADAGSHLLSVGIVFGLSYLVQDYTLLMYALLARPVLQTAISHLMAERPYRWSIDGAYAKRFLVFGWPLVVNGLVLLAVLQGDRFIVGAAATIIEVANDLTGGVWQGVQAYTKADLAVLSLAIATTMMPAMFAASVVPALLYPLMARRQHEPRAFERVLSILASLLAVMSAGIGVLFCVGGESIVVVIYTEQYRDVASFIGALGIAQALKVFRISMTVSCMALGDTQTVMVANIVRSMALIGTVLAALSGVGLVWIAMCAGMGELAAISIGMGRLKRQHSLRLAGLIKPILFMVSWFGVAILVGNWRPYDTDLLAIGVCAGLLVAVVVAAMVVFPVAGREIRSLLANRNSKPQD